LVTTFHPWESGRDDSPIWDDALARVKITVMPKFERLDVKAASSSERPSDEEYNKFIFLVDTMKLYNYDQKVMYEKYPFKIKDVLFSSILYVANWALTNCKIDRGGLRGDIRMDIQDRNKLSQVFLCSSKWGIKYI
jgi:hypothetical protein